MESIKSRLASAWLALRGATVKVGHEREALPPRRACDHLSFEHEGVQWTASSGRYEDGRLGELFLTSSKSGSKVEAMAQDAAICASIAVQYGAPVEIIAAALTRDSRGEPHGPLGRAMDILIGEQARKPDRVLETAQ